MSKIADAYQNDELGSTFKIDFYHEVPFYVAPTIHFKWMEHRLITEKINKDVFFGVFKTRLEVDIAITMASEQSFVDNIIISKENQFWCTLTRTVPGIEEEEDDVKEIFRGYILMDTMGRENVPYPYMLNLVFTDSIGKGTEVDYTYGFFIPAYIGPRYDLTSIFMSIIAMLQQCFLDLKINSIHEFEGFSTWLLKTRNVLIPDAQLYDDDYLDKIALPALGLLGVLNAEYKYNRKDSDITHSGTVKVMDVLEELCRLFNAVFYYSEGFYYFEGIDARLEGSTDVYTYKSERELILPNYTKDEDIPVPFVELDHSNYAILSGGRISYIPPVHSVKCTFKLESYNYLFSHLFDNDNFTTIQQICFVELAGVTTLNFNFIYEEVIDIKFLPEDSFPVWALYRVRIKVGTYYLKRAFSGFDVYGQPNYGPMSWEASAEYCHFATNVVINYNQLDPDGHTSTFNSMSVSTPRLEEGGILEVLIENLGLIMQINESYDFASTTDVELISWKNLRNTLGIATTGETKAQAVFVIAINDEDNLKKIEYDGLYLEYDNPNSAYQVKFWTDDGLVSTAGFSFLGSAIVLPIQYLTTESQAQLRQTTRRMYNMTMKQMVPVYLCPEMLVQYDGSPINTHMITYLEINPAANEHVIELLQLEKGEDPTEIEDYYDVEELVNPNVPGFDSGETTSPVDNYIKTAAWIGISMDYESIPITGMRNDWFEGDRFWIVIPTENLSYKASPLRVMLSEDIADGATNMNFFEVTADKEYPLGSYVIPQDPPKWRVFRFDDVSDAYVTLPIDIPDETLLSAIAMNRRFKVYQNGVRMKYILHGLSKPNYNDFSSEAITKKIHFQTALEGAQIIVEVLWQDQR